MARTVRQLTDLLAEGRSTGGSRVGAGGVIEQVAAGVARVDTGKGLLVEGQRTNLLLRSAEFDDASWAKKNTSVVANAATAPDGTMTADKLVESATTSEHYLQSTGIATNTSLPHTFSFYFRSGEKPYVQVTVYDSVFANSFRCELDVNNAAIVAGTVTVAGTASNASASVVSVGGGVYRFSITGIPASSNSGSLYAARIALLKNDRATNNYTGDGTSGIFIWGAQLEAGPLPTSYIPTTSEQVTRAADRPTLAPAASLSAWQTEKATWIVDVRDACQLDELLSFNGHALLRGVSGSGRVVLAKTSQFTGRVYVDGVFAYEITPEMGVDMNAVGTLLLATGGQAWLRDLRCRPYAMTDTEIANLEVV